MSLFFIIKKHLLFFLLSLILSFSFFASDVFVKGKLSAGGRGGSYKSGSRSSGSYKSTGNVRVRGYTKKDGTYVSPHYRTRPDKSKSNNWSTKGNVNPYTGKKGTKEPY